MERIRPRSPVRREQIDRMYPIWVSVLVSVAFLLLFALSVLGLV
jgi:hypothetical protein